MTSYANTGPKTEGISYNLSRAAQLQARQG